MRIKNVGCGLLGTLLLVLGGGCNRSASDGDHPSSQSTNRQSGNPPSQPTTLAQIHWLGKKRIAAETNAARFMGLWNLPESAKLETQTLDKVALAITGELPAQGSDQRSVGGIQILATNAQPSVSSPLPATNLLSTRDTPLSIKLRPLLDDLVSEEWYWEMEQTPSQPAELALAIRLGGQRSGLWTSNLSAVLGAITNVQSLAAPTNRWTWRLPLVRPDSSHPPRPSRLELGRAGDWTLLGLAREQNKPFDDFATRIQRGQTPLPGPETDLSYQLDPTTRKLQSATGGQPVTFWLEAALNLQGIASSLALDSQRPDTLPKLHLAVTGDGQNVRLRADLDFPKPLPLEMEPWNIPTNLIHDPLIGFAAVRGIRLWLKSCPTWKDLQLGTPPNQAYFWAQGGAPFLHFMAAPSAEASNQVNTLSEFALRKLNPILATNGWPSSAFTHQTNSPGLLWKGIPYFSPDLHYADLGSVGYIFAGLYPNGATNQPAPPGLFDYLEASPTMVAYDWENTRPCVDGWTQMGQLTRHMLCLPRMTHTVGLAWLAALAPKLSNSVTMVELSAPTRLSIVRTSSVGLTGVELHLLADWLESLDFPRGLHSSTAPPPTPIVSGTTTGPAPPR